MNAPRVTVVVPNLNGGEHLTRCLSALKAQDLGEFEVVVVDNGSTDGSVELIREVLDRARVVELGANRGFAGAANAGAAVGGGEFVAFLNNDAEPAPAWLRELVACAERHPRAASIASMVVRSSDPRVIDGAGDAMTRSLKAFRRRAGDRAAECSAELEVFSASGTACLWVAARFRELGGFDESFFAYYEDVDLGFRARLRGFECWLAPGAVVEHVGAATASEVEGVDYRYSLRNRWATTIKNAPAVWLLANAPYVVMGEVLLWARVLRDRQLRLLLRALGQLVRDLPSLVRERRHLQGARTASYRELVALTEGVFPPQSRGGRA